MIPPAVDRHYSIFLYQFDVTIFRSDVTGTGSVEFSFVSHGGEETAITLTSIANNKDGEYS